MCTLLCLIQWKIYQRMTWSLPMTLVNNYASQNMGVSVIYCLTNHPKLNGAKQQPFYCAQRFYGQGIWTGHIGHSSPLLHNAGASAGGDLYGSELEQLGLEDVHPSFFIRIDGTLVVMAGRLGSAGPGTSSMVVWRFRGACFLHGHRLLPEQASRGHMVAATWLTLTWPGSHIASLPLSFNGY